MARKDKGVRTKSWTFGLRKEQEMYSKEQREKALALYDKCQSVTKWIYRCAESACPVFWKSPVQKEEIAVPDRR